MPSNARILIQHCDGMLGMMYGDMLNRVGYQMVTYVSHHPEAIQKAKECDFDLVILDIVSPAGPPYGAEATAEIHAHYADRGGVAIRGISTWCERRPMGVHLYIRADVAMSYRDMRLAALNEGPSRPGRLSRQQ